MLTNRVAATDANDNDRLMALLAYVLSPIVPIIILLVESMKSRPYQKYHAMQALGAGIVMFVISLILGFTVVCACAAPLLWIPLIYYGIIAYQGQGSYFDIPALSNFMRQQGWLPPAGGATA
jgi:uncharacterized membrane protein